jgi:mannose-1-phosphate guanylyltransferase
MKAFILAGGKATRLQPLTCDTAKIMVPVLNRPLLEHFIFYLKKHGVAEVVLALGQHSAQIQKYIEAGGEFAGIKVFSSVEKRSLGTSGAIKNAEKFLGAERFVVFNGDVFTDIDITRMVDFHCRRGGMATIALTPVEDPTAYGVVEIDNDGKIGGFIEKPDPDMVTTNMINAGIYILEPEILDYILPGAFSMFEKDVFPPLLENGIPMYGYFSQDYWIDMGTPEKYLKLNCDLLNRYSGSNAMKIADNVAIHTSVCLEGPMMIGEGCVLEKDVSLRGPAVLGNNCFLREGAMVDMSVLWQGCEIDRGAKLHKCLLGNDCYVGKHSELLKGCVLGSKARIAGNSRLSPGEKIGPSS